jgi:hypothetical protein
MDPQVRQELFELTGALVDGRIAPDAHARLERLLTDDPEARQLFYRYLDIDFGLSQWRLSEGGPTPIEALLQNVGRPAAPRRAARWPHLIAAAVAIVLVSLLLRPLFTGDGSRPDVVIAPAPVRTYVATIARAPACAWADGTASRREGARLTPGRLRLERGVAELRFDGGMTLILDGPAELTVDAADATRLARGRAVLRKDSLGGPFTLRAGASTFVDLGTEYAVSVDPDGAVELHVFEGIVERTRDGASGSDRVEAGQARRFGGAPDAAAAVIPLATQRFVRRVPDPEGPGRNPAADLLVYDGFDYEVPALPTDGSGNGGHGWSGPWHAMGPIPGLSILPARPDSPLAGTCLQRTGQGQIGRKLRTPLRMDRDAVYYLGYLFRQEVIDPRPHINSLHVTCFSPAEAMTIAHRLRVGVAKGKFLFGLLGGERKRVRLPLDDNRVYWLVVKIVAGRTNPDQLFATVYRADEPIDREEPSSWTLVCPAVHTDLVFEDLGIHTVGESRHTFDKLRIGTTWASVLPR